MTAALEGGEWSAARPGRTLLPGKTRYPFYSRLGEPQGRSGRAENLVPTGILSRIVQPIVSRYTDWATGPTTRQSKNIKYSIPALPRSCKEYNSRGSDGLMKDIIITKLRKWIHRVSTSIYTSAIACISRHYPRLFCFVPIWVLRFYSSSSGFFGSAILWLSWWDTVSQITVINLIRS